MNNEKVVKVVKIDGVEVSTELLIKKATELTKLATRVEMAVNLLSKINYGIQKGDEFAVSYFIKNGEISKLTEYLQDCQEEIQQISNEICPD